MPLLGAHQSIAGGYYKAVERAAETDCDCVQLFTKNNNQWRAKPLVPQDGELFRSKLAELGVSHPIAHDSYLINLAAPDEMLWHKSVDAFVEELQRAEALGIGYVVTHPGAFTTSSVEQGIARVAQALDEVHQRTDNLAVQCLLENTAGQGTCLGCDLDHLGQIIAACRHGERLGVCIDTCHLLAAGYELSPKPRYMSTIRELDRTVGLARVKAFHLNDSKKPLGSRVDRHEHIGRGHLGLEPFRLLLNDRRFRRVPMYLETPKGTEKGEDLDVINLRTLRGLVAPARKRRKV